jgi:hypothetical protein
MSPHFLAPACAAKRGGRGDGGGGGSVGQGSARRPVRLHPAAADAALTAGFSTCASRRASSAGVHGPRLRPRRTTLAHRARHSGALRPGTVAAMASHTPSSAAAASAPAGGEAARRAASCTRVQREEAAAGQGWGRGSGWRVRGRWMARVRGERRGRGGGATARGCPRRRARSRAGRAALSTAHAPMTAADGPLSRVAGWAGGGARMRRRVARGKRTRSGTHPGLLCPRARASAFLRPP